MKKTFPASELIINADGSVFHLHVRPEQLADKVILCGDPGRVNTIASHFDSQECNIESREFHTITGTYKGKRISVISTGIGCDNCDIVIIEIDALKNIDFETRTEKEQLTSLEIVRIGTCGGLQPYTPVGTLLLQRNPSVSMDSSTSMQGETVSATLNLRRHSQNTCTGIIASSMPHTLSIIPKNSSTVSTTHRKAWSKALPSHVVVSSDHKDASSAFL